MNMQPNKYRYPVRVTRGYRDDLTMTWPQRA